MLSGAEVEEVGDIAEAGDIAELTGAEEGGATEALPVETGATVAGGGGAEAGDIGVGVGEDRVFMAATVATAVRGVIVGATAGAVFPTDMGDRS